MSTKTKETARGKSAELESIIGKNLDGFRPTPVKYDDVEVKVNSDSVVFQAFITSFLEAVEDVLVVDGARLPEGVTVETLGRYLSYAVYSRVKHVNGKQSSTVWKRHDKYILPSFLYVFLASIGKVEMPELGLYISPEWKGEVPPVDESELTKVSRFLRLLENRGFEMSEGLPIRQEGDWSVMSMEFVGDVVWAMTNEHHPSSAIVASFFAVHGLASVLSSNSYRVKYMDSTQCVRYVKEIYDGSQRRL